MSLDPGIDRILRAAVSLALERRAAWDELDAAVGDGDFGSTVARGAAALAHDPPDTAQEAGLRFARASGGSSGALLGAALLALPDGAPDGDTLRRVVQAITDLGGAEPGDATLLDPLHAAAEVLAGGAAGRDAADAAAGGGATDAAAGGGAGDATDAGDVASAARAAADATAEQIARRGRAAYAGERSQGTPDPGALAVAEVAEALRDGEPPSWDELRGKAPAPEPGGADDLVDRAVDGLVRAHPELTRLDGERGVLRRRNPDGQVAVISGGGAGHEPLHAGFVGEGMLAAACPGAVFTSPATDQMVAAAKAVDSGGGVLFVVKNYTGDALNFRLAEQALTDIATASIVVADDVATTAGDGPGRRGTGATIVVEKLVGAAAARGDDLETCRAIGEAAATDARSFGIAFHGDEMEPGVGIHGEPGREREPLQQGRRLARTLLEPILAEVDTSAEQLVLLSGLGGGAPLRTHALFADVAAEFDERGITISRCLAGDLITSMDQPGAVLTLVPLTDERIALWDAPVHTPALRW